MSNLKCSERQLPSERKLYRQKLDDWLKNALVVILENIRIKAMFCQVYSAVNAYSTFALGLEFSQDYGDHFLLFLGLAWMPIVNTQGILHH